MLYRKPGRPQGWDGRGAENLASTGIRSPDRPARSGSLYRLSYPNPLRSRLFDDVFRLQRMRVSDGNRMTNRNVEINGRGHFNAYFSKESRNRVKQSRLQQPHFDTRSPENQDAQHACAVRMLNLSIKQDCCTSHMQVTIITASFTPVGVLLVLL
jgi:uncharacterized protein YkuJ